jgi:predicted ribosome quality control (RQC) complex YloA/Tae2 family protein
VQVDYALVKNVKKPPGAKPGMVTYDKFKTLIVNPDEALVEALNKN